MQILLTIPTESVYGITHARGLYNAAASEQDQIASDEAYVQQVVAGAVESWCNAANVVPPPPPVDTVIIDGVPQEVTRRQACQALILSNKFALVQPAIDAIVDATQRAIMQSEWEDSQTFQRQRASLIQIGTAIGLTATELDALFVQAATL